MIGQVLTSIGVGCECENHFRKQSMKVQLREGKEDASVMPTLLLK